ncbi:MAG: hypothetical protein KAH20_14700 [Methylococcales bacterium]|nr:hypothetical protein [Methylococcales bacterium]
MTHTNLKDQQFLVKKAVEEGITRYIETRKAKVPVFVADHFSLKGALKLHKKALGKDLYKGPINILWSIPSIMLRVTALALKKIGSNKLYEKLDKLPKGFQTDVQKEVSWLIYSELLEIPYAQDYRISDKDALLSEILSDKTLSDWVAQLLSKINDKSKDPTYRENLEKNLEEYATSRTAASDLAGNILTLSAGYAAFHKAVPGTFAAGSATATAIAQHFAITNFWLGTTVGTWYYGMVPATASTGLLVATTGSLMVTLAIIATFTGIITDPLQAKFGIHQKRLLKFIDAFNVELLGTGQSQYKIKDQYVARVFDILDLLKIASQVIK